MIRARRKKDKSGEGSRSHLIHTERHRDDIDNAYAVEVKENGPGPSTLAGRY